VQGHFPALQEVEMSHTIKDLAILDKFDFEVPPVGVKFSARPPDRIKRLDENLAFCERKMPWELPAYRTDGDEFVRQLMEPLRGKA
jgi:hypothetical protein